MTRKKQFRSSFIMDSSSRPSAIGGHAECSPASDSSPFPACRTLCERQPRRIERIAQDRQRSNTMSKRTRGLLKKVRHFFVRALFICHSLIDKRNARVSECLVGDRTGYAYGRKGDTVGRLSAWCSAPVCVPWSRHQLGRLWEREW